MLIRYYDVLFSEYSEYVGGLSASYKFVVKVSTCHMLVVFFLGTRKIIQTHKYHNIVALCW